MGSPRSKRHKQRSKEASEVLDAFGKRVTEEYKDSNLKFVRNPKGKEKMSAVFFDFIKPYMEHATTKDAFENLVVMGLAAWNAATFQGREREETVKKFLKLMPWRDRRDAQAILEEMIERKDKYYPENNRLILDYQLTMTQNGPHLSVISTQD